jgi:Siderophore-interacting protein
MMPLVSLLSGRQTMRWSAVSSRSSSGPRAPPQPGLVGDRAPCPGDRDAPQPRQRSTDQASAPHRVKWLHHLETPATSSTLLVEAITSATLPAGRGHVYIAGEVQVVAAVQRSRTDSNLTRSSPRRTGGVEKPMPIAASLTDWLARAASGVADSVQEHDALARRMR